MNRPTRTTVVFALASGFMVIPATLLLSPYFLWPTAIKLTIWMTLVLYSLLLGRWGQTGLWPLVFHLALLLAAALWLETYWGFFYLSVGVLSWIRSGVCFRGAPLRTLIAELGTLIGGGGLVMIFGGSSLMSWAVSVCLFTLVQALYFYIVPVRFENGIAKAAKYPFEKAAAEVQKLLDVY
jgi:hypothetical protein